jgi:hypothetical protein
VVRGRLWRTSNPALDLAERKQLVRDLMAARRAVGIVTGTWPARRHRQVGGGLGCLSDVGRL